MSAAFQAEKGEDQMILPSPVVWFGGDDTYCNTMGRSFVIQTVFCCKSHFTFSKLNNICPVTVQLQIKLMLS